MLLWLGEIDRYRKRRDEGTLHGWPRPNSELLKKRKRSPFFPWSQRSRGAAASRRRVTRFMAWPQSRRLLVRSRSAQGRIWLWCEFGSSGSYRLACIVLVYGSRMLLYAVVCCCVLLCAAVVASYTAASMCTASCAVLVCPRTRALCSIQLCTNFC